MANDFPVIVNRPEIGLYIFEPEHWGKLLTLRFSGNEFIVGQSSFIILT